MKIKPLIIKDFWLIVLLDYFDKPLTDMILPNKSQSENHWYENSNLMYYNVIGMN